MKKRVKKVLVLGLFILTLMGCGAGKIAIGKLAGEYDLMGSPLTFTVLEGKLMVELPGQGQFELIRSTDNHNHFTVAGIPDSTIEFVVLEGKVTEAVFKFAGQELKAVRK